MPIRIPILGPVQSGGQVSQIDPTSAVAPTLAIGKQAQAVGQGMFAALGEIEEIQKVKNDGKVSDLMTQAQEAAQAYDASLANNKDPSSYVPGFNRAMDSWKGSAGLENLSPDVRAQFGKWENQFRARQGLKYGEQAAVFSLDQAETASNNAVQKAMDIGDWEGADLIIDSLKSTSPADKEAAKYKVRQREAQFNLDADLATDPKRTLEELRSESWLVENPGASTDLQKWGIQQAEARIKEMERVGVNTAIDDFDNGLAQGKYVSPEQIESEFKDRVSPSVLLKMKRSYDYEQTQAFKTLQASPGYQNQVRGRVTDMLSTFTAESNDYDEKAVEINRLIRSLPEGDATRDELKRNFEAKRSGQLDEVRSLADLSRKAFTDAYKAQFFGKTRRSQSTQSAIDAGLLRDPEKLKQAGFDEDQVEEIIGPEKDSDTERRRRFTEFYPQRKEKKKASDPYLQRSFEAIQSGESQIEIEDAAEKAKAERNLGDALKKFDLWSKQNPDKLNDEESLGRITGEIVSPYGVENFTKTILPPVPSGPPALDLDGPLPELYREAPMDFSPGVLPPLGP